MNETLLEIAAEVEAEPLAPPLDTDACERINAPAQLGALLVIEHEGAWAMGWEANLPEASEAHLPSLDCACLTGPEALIAAAEGLIAWCGEQKERGGKKHKRQAQQLQDWALDTQKKIAEDARAHEKPQAAEPAQAVEGAEIHQAESATGECGLHTGATDGDVRLPAASDAGYVKWIPIEQLHESLWNPRQYHPEAAMQELVESMRASGFREWLPLLVRPHRIVYGCETGSNPEGGYEIGAGHRRRRAAELAGLKQIPCIVRELSDEEFLDVLNFDNSGREDVHPLQEAAGWRVWMERTGKGVLDIAAKIGQSKEYVYQRLKYAALIPAVQEAFLNAEITARHAVLISRLDSSMQLRALEEGCFRRSWEPRGGDRDELVGVRNLAAWIEQQKAGADLADAPFGRADAELLPAAGACGSCEKRADDLCVDRACYDRKLEAHIARKAAAGLVAISTDYDTKGVPAGLLSSQEFEEVAPPEFDELDAEEEEPGQHELDATCEFTEDAIVAHGRDRGKVKRICRNPKCPLHGTWISQQLSRKQKEDEPKDFWSERAKALPRKIENESRYALLRAVLAKPLDWKVPHEHLQLIALSMIPGGGCTEEFVRALSLPGGLTKVQSTSQVEADLQKLIRSPKGSPAADWLPKVCLGLSLKETSKEYCFESSAEMKRLRRAAEVLGVDAKAIETATADRINADFRARRDKARGKTAPAAEAPKPPAKAAAPAPKAKPVPQLSPAGKRRVAAAKKALAKKPKAPKVKLSEAAARMRKAAAGKGKKK